MKKNIPNILSAIRLTLVPVFIYIFFNGPKLTAAIVFALASATDILDGYLARKHNWVTPLGKILDPLADKLMQGAVICCLALDNINSNDSIFFIGVAILFILKESAMLIGAFIVIRKKHDIVVSNWYGKAATVAFFCITTILIFDSEKMILNIVLGVLLVAVLLTALLLYYFKVFRGIYGIKFHAKKKN